MVRDTSEIIIMSMTQDIQQIEVNIAQAKEAVALGECLARLSKNRDFKKLIETRYFKDEAHRLVMLKAAPSMQDEKNQAEIVKDMDGIGSLFQFFCAIQGEAGQMAHSIKVDQAMIDELAASEAAAVNAEGE